MKQITVTSPLNTILINEMETEIPGLEPFQEYTPEQIQKATYIQVNPDDANWQLGFEDIVALEFETLEEYLDCPLSNPHIPVYIY